MASLGVSFKAVLESIIGEKEQISIYDYCGNDDFKKLWALGNSNFDHIHKRHIIIVWDGRGWSDERNENLLSPYLTPMDWALAFSIETLHCERKLEASVSIHIVDLTGEDHDKESKKWAMQMRHQLLVEMPWVKLYASLIPEKDGKSVRIRHGYNPIVASASFHGDSPALLEEISDVIQCPELSEERLKCEEISGGDQQPKLPKEPPSTEIMKNPISSKLLGWLRSGHAESTSKLANGDPTDLPEETNEEMESSEETPQSKDSSGLCLNLSGETLKDAKISDSRDRLIKLARQWGAFLTQSNDHHDVNNVIGPGLWGKKSRPDGMLGAFHTRLSWCDFNLEVRGDDIDDTGKKSLERLEKENLFDKPLSVLIIDDHLMEGWGEFVCKFLKIEFELQHCCNSRFKKIGGKNSMNIYGCTGPDPLIQFLQNAKCKSKFGHRDFSQQIMPNGDEISPEIILLDLRLPDPSKENIKRLLKCLPDQTRGLSWDSINSEEIDSIKDWCDGKSNDNQASYKALLLLPRLLAMALPLTPIILFSSTGQARIKEPLKPYQNIITGFEKPRVLSNPESVKDSIAVLHEALGKAVEMMRLRLQLAHAQKAVKIADNERCKNGISKNGISNHHVEIYADETEIENNNNDIVSGLAVCVFESQEAEQLQSKLECQHQKGNGVVWAKNKGKLSETPELKKEIISETQNQQVDLVLSLLRGLSINNRSNWSVVATRCEISNPNNTISLASFPDAALDAALRFNLEFSLFVLIPYLSKNRFQGTIDIHLPTRVLSIDSQLEKFAEAFGLYINRDKENIRIWPQDSGFPLVRGWLAGWGNEAPLSLEKVKGLKMTSLGIGTDIGITEEEAKERRLFHDIADWVCTAIRPGYEVFRKVLTQKEIFRHWFVNTEDTENTLVLMDALRASANSKNSEQDNDTLRLLLKNTYIRNCDKRLLKPESCSQQRLILWALRDELKNATGPSLHLLCVQVEERERKDDQG